MTRSYVPGSTDGARSRSSSRSGSSASSVSQSQPPWLTPSTYSQPRPTGGATVRIVSKAPDVRVDRDGGDVWVHPDPLLGRRGTGQVGIELLLLDREHRGVHVVDALDVEHGTAARTQQLDDLGVADRERVDVVCGHPGDVGVHRLGGQLDRFGVHRPADPGQLDRRARGRDRRVDVEVDPGGEPPGPVDDHPDRQAQVGRVVRALEGPSRIRTIRLRPRSTRTSAWLAPSSRARSRAASASACNGSAVKSSSTSRGILEP